MNAQLRVKLWVASDAGDFGAGHMQIMHEIARSGSILAASKQLGMSYKKTWSKKAHCEEILGGDIFISQAGRGGESGTRLSERAEAISAAFAQLEQDVKTYAQERYAALLGPLLSEK